MTPSSLVRQSASSVVTVAPRVDRVRFSPPTETVRPSACASTSSMLPATISTTPCLRASSAVSVAASRTALSAKSRSRPRNCARLRSQATASLIALRSAAVWSPLFFSSFGCGVPGRPPIWIGVAAPILVPGAMAARCEA